MVRLIRGIFNVIIPACLIALLFLAFLAWGPSHFDAASAINQAGLQRVRVESIANNSQRLLTEPDQTVMTIASLQTALPVWEQEQTVLANSPDDQIQTYIQDANSPYRLIDQAAHNLLSEYNSKGFVDPVQIKIILQYDRSYLLSINELVFYLQQQSENINEEIAITQTVIIVALVAAFGTKYVLLRRYVYPHLIEVENRQNKRTDSGI